MRIKKNQTYQEYLKVFQEVSLETINNSVANWRLQNTGKSLDWEKISHCDYTKDELNKLLAGVK
jgi:hypothetical protein